jgi:hypothetical protein
MPPCTVRLVVERIGDHLHGSFRIIAYGEGGIRAHADFATVSALLDALHAVVPDEALDLRVHGAILFAREIELSESQLKALGLVLESPGKAPAVHQ